MKLPPWLDELTDYLLMTIGAVVIITLVYLAHAWGYLWYS